MGHEALLGHCKPRETDSVILIINKSDYARKGYFYYIPFLSVCSEILYLEVESTVITGGSVFLQCYPAHLQESLFLVYPLEQAIKASTGQESHQLDDYTSCLSHAFSPSSSLFPGHRNGFLIKMTQCLADLTSLLIWTVHCIRQHLLSYHGYL